MTFADMRVDTPYLVTKESDDGSFQVGDQITLTIDGSVSNTQAEGWLEAEDLADATAGMECDVKEWAFVSSKGERQDAVGYAAHQASNPRVDPQAPAADFDDDIPF